MKALRRSLRKISRWLEFFDRVECNDMGGMGLRNFAWQDLIGVVVGSAVALWVILVKRYAASHAQPGGDFQISFPSR